MVVNGERKALMQLASMNAAKKAVSKVNGAEMKGQMLLAELVSAADVTTGQGPQMRMKQEIVEEKNGGADEDRMDLDAEANPWATARCAAAGPAPPRACPRDWGPCPPASRNPAPSGGIAGTPFGASAESGRPPDLGVEPRPGGFGLGPAQASSALGGCRLHCGRSRAATRVPAETWGRCAQPRHGTPTPSRGSAGPLSGECETRSPPRPGGVPGLPLDALDVAKGPDGWQTYLPRRPCS